MGEFTMTCLRRGLRRRVVQDNILHDEGADYLLRRMFPVGGAFTGARSDWQLCIGGIRCTQPAATPNGNLGIFFDYDRGTTYAEIAQVAQNEGGAYGADHATILGYARVPVSFSRSNLGRSVIIETGEGEFANVIPWADLGDYTPNPAPQHHPHYVPNHGYPWFRPIWKGDYFGSSGIPKAWSDMLTRNPNTAATFSVANAFVVSPSGAPILLASANLARCLVVRPDGELYVAYRGQIRPGATTAGGWTTARFADLLAQRAFLDIASTEATNYRAVLLSDPPGSLDWNAKLTSVVELDDSGYAPQSLSNWTKGVQPYEVTASCSGWSNTSGATWTTANYVGIVAAFDGDDELCWFEPISPVTLADGDSLTFPSGVEYALRDAL
jgi:hypothetical protein